MQDTIRSYQVGSGPELGELPKLRGSDRRTEQTTCPSNGARTRLAAFPARTKEISGRRSLHLDDCERWKGRTVTGRLLRREGFVTAAWKVWVVGHPELAGVPAAPVTCYAAAEPYSVHEAAEAARRQLERGHLLAGFRKWSLHDFDQDGGYFARPLPLFQGGLREEVAAWLEKAGLFATQVYRLQAVVAQVGERYFDGASALFPDVAESLAQDAEIWEHASDLSGQAIGELFEGAASVSGLPAPRFDLTAARAAGEQQAPELAECFVDVAKAQTLRL